MIEKGAAKEIKFVKVRKCVYKINLVKNGVKQLLIRN